MDETSDKHDMNPLIEPIVGNPVGIPVESYGNGDKNLCSIQPPDENDDQYELDINDLNKKMRLTEKQESKMWGQREISCGLHSHRKSLIRPKIK